MTTTHPTAALLLEMDLELRHAKQMVGLLEEEQRELLAGRVDRLESLAAGKPVQSRSLDLYAGRRAAFLRAQASAPTGGASRPAPPPRGSRGDGCWKPGPASPTPPPKRAT